MSGGSHPGHWLAEDDQAVGVEQQPVTGLEPDVLPDRTRVQAREN
jgi:hypothetical protein